MFHTSFLRTSSGVLIMLFLAFAVQKVHGNSPGADPLNGAIVALPVLTGIPSDTTIECGDPVPSPPVICSFGGAGITTGYAASVVTDNGVADEDEILGPPDGDGARFFDGGDNLTVEFDHILPAGAEICITWKRRSYSASTSDPYNSCLRVFESNAGDFENTQTLVTPITFMVTQCFDLTYSSRFLRLRNEGSCSDFEIDAIGYSFGLLVCGDDDIAATTPGVTVLFSEVAGACSGGSFDITRTWTATNLDGSTVYTQVITVTDTTPPVLVGVPADVSVVTLPPPPVVTASDFCSASVPVVFSETVSLAGATRIWTAADDCGNTVSDTQHITITAAPETMHIVFVVVDDLNDYVWSDGNQNPATPNVARVGAMGTSFSSCYANSPLCCPSRISMLVGQSPYNTGIYKNQVVNDFRDHFGGNQVVTIPEHLRENGYYTIGINKIFHNFWKSSFDNDFEASEPDPLARGLSWNEYELLPDLPYSTSGNDLLSGTGYSWAKVNNADENKLTDHRAVSRAIQHLEDYNSDPSAYGDQPLFLNVGLIKPHVPHSVPAKYFPSQYVNNILSPSINYRTPSNPGGWPLPEYGPGGADQVIDNLHPAAKMMAEVSAKHQVEFDKFGTQNAGLGGLTAGELESMRMANANMAYYATVKYIDAQIGRLLDALDSLGMTENTVIILTSDHGFSQGEHRHWAKKTLWDEDLRVPLIIADPRIGHTIDVDQTVSLLDIFPTLTDLADVPDPVVAGNPDYLEGKSVVPLMQGQYFNRPAWSFIDLGKNDTLSCDVSISVRDDDFHLIRLPYDETPCNAADKEEVLFLYDLNRDPKEWQNLSSYSEYLQTANFMKDLLPIGGSWEAHDIPGFRIVSSEPDTISPTTVLTLTYQLFDPAGNFIPTPPGNYVTWQANISGVKTVDTTEVDLDFAELIDELASDSTFTVQAYYKDGSAGQVLAHDRLTIKVVDNASAFRIEEETNSDQEDFGWYDLLGRKVTEPVPNQIYISTTGKKIMILD